MTMLTSSSSSFFTYQWTYDVFLSFRGTDTRMGFTGNLYNALCEKGIKTFMDDQEIWKGEEIKPALMKAIQESRIAIVIFSKNYASSTFCLEELVKIMECIRHKGRLVWPIFYQVDPSHVRHQKGSYAKALAKHERKINDKEKVKKWRSTLQDVANLSGWHFEHGYEYEFIGKIIQEISTKINRRPLHVANYPIGLESRVQKVNSLLELELTGAVHMVGIYGMGGMGKTTLACAIYNFIADKFENVCFLANIRENSMKHGLVQVQETLLFDIGEKDIKLGNVNKGISIIRNRLHQKKTLLILDDVDKLEQLKALSGGLDWFGLGSRIIIITRNKQLLHAYGTEKIYEVEGLNYKEALELFSWNAFKKEKVDSNYMEMSKRIILFSNGHPLFLEIVGSDLFGKTMLEWKSALDTYERIPHESIQEILSISFNGLKEFEKEIFLDIACFFKAYQLTDVKSILLHGRGFSPEYAIQVLIDKCLIKIDQNCCVRMHDLIEDMGREIVRQESPLNPGERSRLWCTKDILHVLKENKGTDKIEIIVLHSDKYKEVEWDGSGLERMENLKVLIVKNVGFSRGSNCFPKGLKVLKWWAYPEPLPYNCYFKKLAILDLSMSFLTFDNLSTLKFKHLKEMRLSGCPTIKQVPNMSGAPNLMELHLDFCKNLVEVHESIGFLDKLEHLNVDGCTNLRVFLHAIDLTSLKHLSLVRCTSLKSFPEILGKMENIRCINLKGSGIMKLPFSTGNLIGLEYLNLDQCYGLVELPDSLFTLPKLEMLRADYCEGFAQFNKGKRQKAVTISSNVRDVRFGFSNVTDEFLGTFLPYFHNVRALHLESSNITIIPACIVACRFLHRLVLDQCRKLREIRTLPPSIKYLSAINCTSLTSKSKQTLLSEALHKAGDTQFCVPGSTLPNWFNDCGKEQSLSFLFRNKFPAVALCVVTDVDGWERIIRVNINGITIQCFPFHYTGRLDLETDHIFLIHLPHKFDKEKLERVCMKNEGNRVNLFVKQIQLQVQPHSYMYVHDLSNGSRSEAITIKHMGVHVYQQNSTMAEDVRFTNPM